MNNRLRIVFCLVLAVGVVGCDDSEGKNKLFDGTLTNEKSMTGGGAVGDTVTVTDPNTDRAASVVGAAATAVNLAGTGVAVMATSAAGPGGPLTNPFGTVDTEGFYSMTRSGMGPLRSTTATFRLRFRDNDGATIDLFNLTEEPLPTPRFIDVRVSGTDPNGNAFVTDMTQDLGVQTAALTDARAFMSGDMILNGTISVSGPAGRFQFPAQLLISKDTGLVRNGTASGTGTLPDGTEVPVSITWTEGAATGTATVSGQGITVQIGPDGTGTYRDSGGTHGVS